MQCARCQREAPPDAAFCPECGAPLVVHCAQCGTENAPGYKFCKKCGQPLTTPPAREREGVRFTSPQSYTPKHLAEKILTSKNALEGERKQVTVLFCDLANSTALAERLGPEPMHDLLDQFFELALGEVHRYEGTISQFLGDGFMALFGAPLAHEDDARRAVLAGLGIERPLRDWHAEPGDTARATVQVRMGLNTGFVVVGRIGDNLRMDYTAVGDTTNLAARLEQLADPGAILISETTHRLVHGMVRAERLPLLQVKGKSEPSRGRRPTRPFPCSSRRSRSSSCFGFPQWHGMFTASLAEAYRFVGDVAKARTLIQRGLEITRGARYWFGVGYGQRVLGRIARAESALDEAESHLTGALQTFESIGADFEIARSRLELADLVGHRGNLAGVRTHLGLALRTFESLGAPRYVERVNRLARELGVAILS